MLICGLKVKNYRGLNIDIDTVEKVSILIGQNDSGKTNICSAILKVLDYNKRRIPLVAADSTNSNKDNIEIEIKLTADDLTNEQSAIIGNYIHIDNEGKKYMIAKLTSTYNEDTLEYEDTLIYGDPTIDFEEVRINTQTQLDKVLSIVYINPVYDIENSKKDFFKFKETDNKENGIYFSENILKEINNLNETIQNGNKRTPLKINNVYIIKHVEIPTVIVECGFLSNPEEEKQLQQEEYQTKLAWGIYNGIMEYF